MSNKHFSEAFVSQADQAVPLHVVAIARWEAYLEDLTPVAQAWWAQMRGTEAPKSGTWLAMPDTTGAVDRIVAVLDMTDDEAVWQMGQWVRDLPEGAYALVLHGVDLPERDLCLAWGMGAYRFDRYQASNKAHQKAQLIWPNDVVKAACEPWLETITWVRNMINTPANDCNPAMMTEEMKHLTEAFGGVMDVTVGDDLLNSFPAVHAVGRASEYPPRLVCCRFGKPDHPKVVLVGKGVCFDSGGINMKTSAGMVGMKKDMGGAAHALGLAKYLLAMQLPIQLVVIVPLVENSVSANAYRTGDVIPSRLGVSIEVNNTDAEGRLILADALALACEERPELIIDFATLTGAQRVGMGPDIPSFYTDQTDWSDRLAKASVNQHDPIWRAPLYQPYKSYLKSDIADISNAASIPYGGSITAALFLQRFVEKDVPWVHFDLMASNHKNRPARPKGGEAMGIRACAEAIESWLAE